MSLCAIIPANLMQAANDTLEQAGYGPNNFSVPCYGATGATHGALHTWGDIPFENAIKAITGVVWEQSGGDPSTRFKSLVEAQGVKWGAQALALPKDGKICKDELYTKDETLWYALANAENLEVCTKPALYPALICSLQDPQKIKDWKPIGSKLDDPLVKNPFQPLETLNETE